MSNTRYTLSCYEIADGVTANDDLIDYFLNRKSDPLPQSVESLLFDFCAVPPEATASMSDFFPLEKIQEIILSIPRNVTSLRLNLKQDTNKDNIKTIISSIPEHVTSLTLDFNKKVHKDNIKEIISSIPEHVINITIPNNIFKAFKDNDNDNKKLAEVFKAFHPMVKTIDTAENAFEKNAVPDSRLKKVLLQLPLSVTTLGVQRRCTHSWDFKTSRVVDPKSFRDKHYFSGYEKVVNTPTTTVPNNEDTLFCEAKRILYDYSKGDSFFPASFFFHWGRNHIDAVNNCLKNSDNFHALYANIKKINLVNPIGSLARRIRYIEMLPEFQNYLLSRQGLTFNL